MTPVSSSSPILLLSKNLSDPIKNALGAGQSISRLLPPLVPSIRSRFRQMIADELFISAEAAAGSNTVKYIDPEPPVARCYIGPDVNEDLPTNGRNN